MATRGTVTEVIQEERQSLLVTGRPLDGSVRGSYGSVAGDSPRVCLWFNDAYLGGKRSAWLAKLRALGFVVEQTSASLVAVAAPDEMLNSIAAQRGSHGQHTMPATRERSLHLLLSEVDPTFAAFLEVPGPFSKRSKRARLSPELEELGLMGWFWLHNKEAAGNIAPRYAWSGCFGLAREPLKHAREYFGTEIAWDLLFLNFVSRWMLVPAVGGVVYSYVMALSFISTGSVDNPFMPVFSGAMMLWGLLMLGFWVRLKTRYEDKWREDVAISGVEDVNTDAEMQVVVDDETGEVKLVYPQWKHQAKLLGSAVFLLPCAALILGAGLGALDLRARIINLDPNLVDGISIGWMLGGLVTAVLVFVAVRGVALHWCGVLTHWENHTRRSSYQYAYNAKCFWLETLGHVFPMIYLALLDLPILSRFAPATPASGSLLDALTIQATTVFLAWWMAAGIGMWWETSRWQKLADKRATDEQTGKPDMSHEEQSQRPTYEGGFKTNNMLSMQLLYTFVFCAVCPLAPLLLYLWVISRQHWQRTALVYVFQRPHPQAAPGGGFWGESLPIIICLALAVQIPLVLFCSRALTFWAPQVTLEDRWGLLMTLEMCVVVLSAYLIARTSRFGAAPQIGQAL